MRIFGLPGFAPALMGLLIFMVHNGSGLPQTLFNPLGGPPTFPGMSPFSSDSAPFGEYGNSAGNSAVENAALKFQVTWLKNGIRQLGETMNKLRAFVLQLFNKEQTTEQNVANLSHGLSAVNSHIIAAKLMPAALPDFGGMSGAPLGMGNGPLPSVIAPLPGVKPEPNPEGKEPDEEPPARGDDAAEKNDKEKKDDNKDGEKKKKSHKGKKKNAEDSEESKDGEDVAEEKHGKHKKNKDHKKHKKHHGDKDQEPGDAQEQGPE